MENESRRNGTEQVFLAVCFAAYLAGNGILLFLHEQWRDEANVWLMARDLSPFQLLAEIKYQGHPCLWYFLLMPFAKAGLPFWTIGLASMAVMAAAAAVFLWKAPISPSVKVVCLASTGFTYFYPVIARNYCLIALLLVLLAWRYPNRNQKPVVYGLLLGMLVQADTIAIAVAGLISLMWVVECICKGLRLKSKKPLMILLKGIWIPPVSVLLWIAQFYQVSDSPQFQPRFLGFGEILHEIRNFSYVILIRLTGWQQWSCRVFFLAFIAVVLFLAWRIRNFWAPAVMMGAYLFQAAFSALVYQLHIWHFLTLFFTFIWMIWVMKVQWREKEQVAVGEQKKGQSGKQHTRYAFLLSEALLTVLALFMLLHWNSQEEPSNFGNALRGSYSDAGNAADYLRENLAADDLLVSVDVPMVSTILAHLGKDWQCYYAGNGKRTSYADWSNEQKGKTTLEQLRKWAHESFPQKDALYLIWVEDGCIEDEEKLIDFELLYESKETTVRTEEYRIYRIPLGDGV